MSQQLTMHTPADGGAPTADLSKAPLPNKSTLSRRQSVPLQFLRFAGFNLRLIRMVLKGH